MKESTLNGFLEAATLVMFTFVLYIGFQGTPLECAAPLLFVGCITLLIVRFTHD